MAHVIVIVEGDGAAHLVLEGSFRMNMLNLHFLLIFATVGRYCSLDALSELEALLNDFSANCVSSLRQIKKGEIHEK